MNGSLASLALQGLISSTEEETILLHRMLAGRYQEVRMLLFLGKDVFRWMQQCAEHLQGLSDPDSRDVRIVEQSFAALIVEDPPESVKHKLEGWGVTDRPAVFSRAIGIHSMFREPPPLDSLAPGFLKNYHRYADHAYICYQHSQAFRQLDATSYPFEIYASEEYSRLLSDSWERE